MAAEVSRVTRSRIVFLRGANSLTAIVPFADDSFPSWVPAVASIPYVKFMFRIWEVLEKCSTDSRFANLYQAFLGRGLPFPG
jgi:hypothetical protein